MKQVPRLVLIVAAVAAVSACASSADASNVKAPPSPSSVAAQSHIAPMNPCTLVTASDASKAAGRTLVNDVLLGASPVAGGCFYGAKGTSSGVYVYMQVYPDSATAGAVTAEQLESVMSGQLGSVTGEAKQVDGIGDKAIELTAKGKAGSGIGIVVYRSNVVFIVAVTPTTNAGNVEALAKTAVGRLH